MPKLTKRVIDCLHVDSGRAYSWDTDLPGFGILTLPSGVKSFILQYRNSAGRSRRLTIGRYGKITLDEARKLAKEAQHEVACGGDPLGDRSAYRQAPTLNDLLDRYISEHLNINNSASTQSDVAALVTKHLRPRIGTIKVADLCIADIAKVHLAMKRTPRRANHAIAVLSKALSLAEVWGFRPVNSNPCSAITRYSESQRNRFLSGAEVKRLGDALIEAETVGIPYPATNGRTPMPTARTVLTWQAVAAIRLLLLTGARLSEILGLRWVDVDNVSGTIALPIVKGGKRSPHPINSASLALVESLPRDEGATFVLPSPVKRGKHLSVSAAETAWHRLRWHAGIKDVHLHDLRHTVGTFAAQAGVSSFIVRDLLRHRNIATTGRYANFDADPVRQLSEAVGERIVAGLKGKLAAEVIPPHEKKSQ